MIKHWPEWRRRALFTLYTIMPDEDLSQMFGMSVAAIREHASLIGIKKSPHYRHPQRGRPQTQPTTQTT